MVLVCNENELKQRRLHAAGLAGYASMVDDLIRLDETYQQFYNLNEDGSEKDE